MRPQAISSSVCSHCGRWRVLRLAFVRVPNRVQRLMGGSSALWPGGSSRTRAAATGLGWDHGIRLVWSGLFLRSERPRRCAIVTLVPEAPVTEQAASGLSPRLSPTRVSSASSLSAVTSAAGSAPLPPAPAHSNGPDCRHRELCLPLCATRGVMSPVVGDTAGVSCLA